MKIWYILAELRCKAINTQETSNNNLMVPIYKFQCHDMQNLLGEARFVVQDI